MVERHVSVRHRGLFRLCVTGACFREAGPRCCFARVLLSDLNVEDLHMERSVMAGHSSCASSPRGACGACACVFHRCVRVGTRLISFILIPRPNTTHRTEQTNNIIVGLVPHLATTVLRYETLGDLLCTKLST